MFTESIEALVHNEVLKLASWLLRRKFSEADTQAKLPQISAILTGVETVADAVISSGLLSPSPQVPGAPQ